MQASPPEPPGGSGGGVGADETMPNFSRRLKPTIEPSWFAVRVCRGACWVIEVRGELDLAGAPVLESAVQDLKLSSVRDAVLDLRRLTFIDAAGLNAVVDLYAECLNLTAALTIIPGPRNVQRLFELTRLDRLLPFSGPLDQEERPCPQMTKQPAIERPRA
jgi:anti-sigma B factor antagonist